MEFSINGLQYLYLFTFYASRKMLKWCLLDFCGGKGGKTQIWGGAAAPSPCGYMPALAFIESCVCGDDNEYNDDDDDGGGGGDDDNAVERRRRYNINDRIHELASLLPKYYAQ